MRRTAALSGMLLAGLLALSGSAGAGTNSASVEIAYLLNAVEQGDCRFLRNGSWYSAHAAADHLRAKYQLKSAAGVIASAEEFIAKVASRSSFSGEAYEVQCAGRRQEPSAAWLSERLREYRQRLSPDATHHT